MHSLNRSWRPKRGRPTKRKANLSLNRVEKTKKQKTKTVWSKLLQNIKCSECGEQELSVEFSDAIGHSSKIILKCMSCS